jgi:serine/threonine-protein kinase
MVRPSLRDRLQRGLGDAFVLDRELSGAGMSRVFVATETQLSRPVVIKVLAPEITGEISAERFRREINFAATLQHPNIVPLISAGEADGMPYFTMPFVEGETLRQRLQRGPLELNEGFTLFRDVLRALAYAHQRGVVHRDIKPENIMISHGTAVVTDFGVAKALEDSQNYTRQSMRTSMGMAVGTPAYMAPEQAAADPAIDSRADIYALGLVAYEALSGAHVFAGKSGVQLLTAQAMEQPIPLKERAPKVPSAVANMIMRTLAKDRDERPRTAEEVLAVIEQVGTPRASTAISGTFQQYPRTTAGTAAFVASRRRLTWLAVAAALCALLLAAYAWKTFGAIDRPAEATEKR